MSTLTFDHIPDADEVMVAIRGIVRDHGKPLSNPASWLGRANENHQVLMLLASTLREHEPRLAMFLDAYIEACMAELSIGGMCVDDLLGCADNILKAAREIADEFAGIAVWGACDE